MGHPFLGYGVDVREGESDWLLGFSGFSLGFAFRFVTGFHGFGFAEEDLAEAGRASLLFDLFRVGTLF